MDIKLLQRDDIEKNRWNGCVHYAPNGNVFGYTWYLDAVAREWEGLIEGNYESVFPLPYRTNFLNKKELYQPPLMRELGIYSINMLSEKRIENFLNAIPEEYRYLELAMNSKNEAVQKLDFAITPRTNYQLNLHQPYDKLSEQYTPTFQEQLAKAEAEGYAVSGGFKPEKVAEFYQKYATDRKHLTRNFHAAQRIMYNALHRGWGFASGVVDSNGDLVATNFFIYSHHKVISFLPAMTPQARQNGAMELMMDTLLQSHANRPQILDFNVKKEEDLAINMGAEVSYFYELKKDKRTFGIF